MANDPQSHREPPESEEPVLAELSSNVRLIDIQADIDEINRLFGQGKVSDDYIKAVSQKRIAVWRQAAEEGSPDGQWLVGKC